MISRDSALFAATLFAICLTTHAAVQNVDGVKDYLVKVTSKMEAASTDFSANAGKYAALIDTCDGDYAKAYAAKKPEIGALVKAMQADYKAMDSYGYETVEGIIGGVDSFAHYDRDLDAGVPAADGAEGVAEVTLTLRDGSKIDRQGSVFTFLVEPALWGGDPRWVVPMDLDGDGKIAPRESLPKADVLLACSDYTAKALDSLRSDAAAWKPTTADCIGAMVVMTPTLSDYFDDWKESRYSEKQSGRFYAVSRVSDMRGIMGSCAIMYQAVDPEVATRDAALAKSIRKGFDGITLFLDKIDIQEKDGDVTLAEIDEMASQAKAHTDKLVPQIEQAQALVENN